MAIAPDTVHGEQEQDFSQGCSHRAADLLILTGTLYRWDIAPVGEGLTGRGRNAPSPVACVSCGGVLTSGSTPHLPAAAAGECLAIGPDTVSGEQERDLDAGDPPTRGLMLSHGTVSMDDRPTPPEQSWNKIGWKVG